MRLCEALRPCLENILVVSFNQISFQKKIEVWRHETNERSAKFNIFDHET